MADEMRVRQAEVGHIRLLLDDIRQADLDEISVMGDPYDVLERSLRSSTVAWTAFFGERVGAMFGVVPTSALSGRAIPWLITGNAIEHNKKTFMYASQKYLREILHVYPILFNLIDARYKRSLRWAEAIGFKPVANHLIGENSVPFTQVSIGE